MFVQRFVVLNSLTIMLLIGFSSILLDTQTNDDNDVWSLSVILRFLLFEFFSDFVQFVILKVAVITTGRSIMCFFYRLYCFNIMIPCLLYRPLFPDLSAPFSFKFSLSLSLPLSL